MLLFRKPVPFLLLALTSSVALGAVHKPAKPANPPKAAVGEAAKELKAKAAEPKKTELKKTLEPVIRNWGLDNTEFASHIEAKRAWKITEGDSKIVVAVIDTGIDASHKDLKDNLWRKPGTADEFGWDFVFGKKNPGDTNGHGTHIAGIIAGSSKSRSGALGVAPKVTIMPIRYYADETVETDTVGNIVKAIDYAVANGARIINFSSEGIGFNMAEYKAIKRASEKGVLVVTAAGNRGLNNDSSDTPCYPASYDLPNILTVAATNIQNEISAISNWGPTKVHVSAPGEDIFSSLHNGRYGYLSGTSQATAFVSGVAALLLSENPELSVAELKQIISSTVDKSPKLEGKVASGGRVNAFKALTKAIAMKQELPGPQRAVAATATAAGF